MYTFTRPALPGKHSLLCVLITVDTNMEDQLGTYTAETSRNHLKVFNKLKIEQFTHNETNRLLATELAR